MSKTWPRAIALGGGPSKSYIPLMITELNSRAQNILRYIVDSYLESGEPVGSRTIARGLELNLSAATIRNVMADLESEGLLYAPHTSAGRLPTQTGMRLYIDGLMEVGDLSEEERRNIERQCHTEGQSINALMERATSLLSGLSAAAGVVVAPKADKPIKHIEFLRLDRTKVLIVMVMGENMVENRVMEVSSQLPDSALIMAANYLNHHLKGQTLARAREQVSNEINKNRAKLDRITSDLVERGLALAPNSEPEGHLIVRGQSKLLQDVKALDDLEKARKLLIALEEQQTVSRLLKTTQDADGVQIFIGTENNLFEHSGWSMVLSPYKSPENNIIGAIGVIGPVRLNYERIIPVVDYTAQVMGRLLTG